MMKRCANPKCNKIFYPDWTEKNVVYCPDCRKMGMKRKAYDNKKPNRKIGNKGQDSNILKFLKRKEATFAELCRLAYEEKDPAAIAELERRRRQ